MSDMDSIDLKKIAIIAVAVIALIVTGLSLKVHHDKQVAIQAQYQMEEEGRQRNAWDAIDKVWDRTKQKIKPEATMELLGDARRAIDIVENEEVKANMEREYTKAETALTEYLENAAEAEERARKVVDELWDQTNQKIFDGVTRADIDEAKEAVEIVPDKSVRTELEETIEKAEAYIKDLEDTATEAIESVWDKYSKKLQEEATKEMYDEARAKVDAVPDGEVKKSLLETCELIEAEFLQMDETQVKAVFDSIWNSGAGRLVDGTTRADFEDALAMLNTLPEDSTVRKDIEKILPDIEDALNIREEEEEAQEQERFEQEEAERQAEQEQQEQQQDEEASFPVEERPEINGGTISTPEISTPEESTGMEIEPEN